MRRFNTWADLFLSGAQYRPDGVGFCVLRDGEEPESITRAELVDRALRVSQGLQDLGLTKGSVVVLTGEPSVAWVVTFAAVLLAGGMPAPTYPRCTRDEFERVMATSGATFAVISAASDVLDWDTPERNRTIVTLERADGVYPSVVDMYQLPPAEPVICADTDPAVVLQTSGTTGNPKCVVHTHRSHMEYVDRMTENTMTADDRILSFMPLNHQAGLLVFWIAAFSVGAACYQTTRFSVAGFWEAIHGYGITWTGMMDPVPAHLLAAQPREDDREHTLDFILGSTTQDMSELARRFGFRFRGSYGSTEAPIVALSIDLDRPELSGLTAQELATCAGKPLRDWQLRVLRSDGTPASPFEIGSLEVTGPPLFSYYLNDPESTSRALTEDGWYRTGDRTYLNEHGELFFVERSGNTIRRSGEFISATEVEATLMQHPAISDVCVIAVPDELRYQEARACLVRVPGTSVTAQEIYDYCQTRLTRFKIPRYLDFWQTLPRTATGKISRSELNSDPTKWIDRHEIS